MRLANTMKVAGRARIGAAAEEPERIIEVAERIDVTQLKESMQINVNDKGLREGTMTISLVANNNPYNCIFVENENEVEAVGGHYDNNRGMLEVSTKGNGTYYVMNNRKSFHDIEGLPEANQKAINILASKGIVSSDEKNFEPDQHASRAEVTSALVKMSYLLDQQATCEFEDVANNAWYYPYVASSKHYGIVSGYADNTFRPNNDITLNEMVKLDSSVLTYKKGYLYPADKNMFLNGFSNPKDIPEWVSDYLALAVREGLLLNDEAYLYIGERPLTNLEAAMLLYRLYMKL